MENYNSPEIINVGTGEDITISSLAELVKETIEYDGNIEFDMSTPDGVPRKLLDVSKIRTLGWKHKISLPNGVADTIRWFREST